MDPILVVFGVVAATAAAQAALEWWRRRPWAAAPLAVVAAVAVTPLTVGMPDLVIVGGLLVLTGVVGFLVWPRPRRGSDHGGDRAPDGSDEGAHGAPGGPGAGHGGRS